MSCEAHETRHVSKHFQLVGYFLGLLHRKMLKVFFVSWIPNIMYEVAVTGISTVAQLLVEQWVELLYQCLVRLGVVLAGAEGRALAVLKTGKLQ